MQDHYNILNVKINSRYWRILHSFEKLVRKEPREIQKIIYAYQILANEDRKKFYDIVYKSNALVPNKNHPDHLLRYKAHLKPYNQQAKNFIGDGALILIESSEDFWKSKWIFILLHMFGFNYWQENAPGDLKKVLFLGHLAINFVPVLLLYQLNPFWILLIVPILLRLFVSNYLQAKKLYYNETIIS